MLHFKYYPRIEYANNQSINIMVRGKIRNAIQKNIYVYYKYVIKDGERADVIAEKYYGNSSFTWAIFYANDIYDPIFDWPLSLQQFRRYIARKYGSVERAKDEVHTPPHHYLLDNKYIIDKTTYEDPMIEMSRKQAVSNYYWEHDINEDKRNINVLDKAYLFQVNNELKNLFR